jgi:hypothetical protein
MVTSLPLCEVPELVTRRNKCKSERKLANDLEMVAGSGQVLTDHQNEFEVGLLIKKVFSAMRTSQAAQSKIRK